MRRPAPALPVSSKQLKHFAAATVTITALLALFAGGEDAGVAAQIQATQAKNDLIAQEQKHLGTKKIVKHLKVQQSGGGFGGDEGGDFGGGSSGGGGGGANGTGRPMAQAGVPAFLPPSGLAARPGGTLNRKSLAKSGKAGDSDTSARGFGQDSSGAEGGGPPDTSGLADAIEASRMRSGSAGRDGD